MQKRLAHLHARTVQLSVLQEHQCAAVAAGAPSSLSQDRLFTRAIAARVVPRAARYDTDLAAAVCEPLEDLADGVGLDGMLEAVGGPPEVKNIVLETALSVSGSSSGAVENAMLEWLQDSEPGLMPHLRRSVSFILAASSDSTILGWLVGAAVLDELEGTDFGLRQGDKATLYKRVTRGSVEGFRAAAERLQEYAGIVEDWDWEDVAVDVSPFAVMGQEASLPAWLPLEELEEGKQRALMLEKQSDAAAARIVCGIA